MQQGLEFLLVLLLNKALCMHVQWDCCLTRCCVGRVGSNNCFSCPVAPSKGDTSKFITCALYTALRHIRSWYVCLVWSNAIWAIVDQVNCGTTAVMPLKVTHQGQICMQLRKAYRVKTSCKSSCSWFCYTSAQSWFAFIRAVRVKKRCTYHRGILYALLHSWHGSCPIREACVSNSSSPLQEVPHTEV